MKLIIPKKPSPKQVKRLEELWHRLYHTPVILTTHTGERLKRILSDQEIWNIREGKTVNIEPDNTNAKKETDKAKKADEENETGNP